MLYDYLVNNYEKGEPIFLMDIVIKGMGFINVKKACTVMINKNAKPYIETRASILGGCHE